MECPTGGARKRNGKRDKKCEHWTAIAVVDSPRLLLVLRTWQPVPTSNQMRLAMEKVKSIAAGFVCGVALFLAISVVGNVTARVPTYNYLEYGNPQCPCQVMMECIGGCVDGPCCDPGSPEGRSCLGC